MVLTSFMFDVEVSGGGFFLIFIVSKIVALASAGVFCFCLFFFFSGFLNDNEMLVS